MLDTAEVLILGDRTLLGPRASMDVVAVVRYAAKLADRHGSGAVPVRIINLANRIEFELRTAVDGSAAVSPTESPVASSSSLIDPISTTQAAELLGCTANNIRQKIRRGTLAGQKFSGEWMIDRHDIERQRHDRQEA